MGVEKESGKQKKKEEHQKKDEKLHDALAACEGAAQSTFGLTAVPAAEL